MGKTNLKTTLKDMIPVAEAIACLLHPFAEVVIHDLQKDQVEAIYNPISQREVGDDSYLDRWDFTIDPKENIIGPYEKMNYDGRKLKSISIVLRNNSKKAVGFLCINMDISIFDHYQQTLKLFLNNNDPTLSEEKQSLFKDDLYEQINQFIQHYCQSQHLSISCLDREHKQIIVRQLKEKGAFNGKNASGYIARILNISRATVYNYFKETENKT
ncbi:MAG: PAS domain-containing protein [Pseudomonadota bacterium]